MVQYAWKGECFVHRASTHRRIDVRGAEGATVLIAPHLFVFAWSDGGPRPYVGASARQWRPLPWTLEAHAATVTVEGSFDDPGRRERGISRMGSRPSRT